MDPSDLADVLASVRAFVRGEVVPLEERIEDDNAVPHEIVAACKGASTASPSPRRTAGSA